MGGDEEGAVGAVESPENNDFDVYDDDNMMVGGAIHKVEDDPIPALRKFLYNSINSYLNEDEEFSKKTDEDKSKDFLALQSSVYGELRKALTNNDETYNKIKKYIFGVYDKKTQDFEFPKANAPDDTKFKLEYTQNEYDLFVGFLKAIDNQTKMYMTKNKKDIVSKFNSNLNNKQYSPENTQNEKLFETTTYFLDKNLQDLNYLFLITFDHPNIIVDGMLEKDYNDEQKTTIQKIMKDIFFEGEKIKDTNARLEGISTAFKAVICYLLKNPQADTSKNINYDDDKCPKEILDDLSKIINVSTPLPAATPSDTNSANADDPKEAIIKDLSGLLWAKYILTLQKSMMKLTPP
jgi:hypothetical protein